MSGTKSHRGWGWIRKRPSGRFQASFIGPDRKRHFGPTTFSNRMRAERWLANERDLIERAAESGERWLTPDERAAKALWWLNHCPNTASDGLPSEISKRARESTTKRSSESTSNRNSAGSR